jgi:hypothetical protein
MKLFKKIKNLDSGEKDFLMIALAFTLVALFLFVAGYFKADITPTSTKIYFGFSDVDIESLELNEIQKLSCTNADKYNSCFKLDETLIISKEVCCKKMELCCS